MSKFAAVVQSTMAAFLARCGGSIRDLVRVYDESTEEIADGLRSGRRVQMHMAGRLANAMTGAKSRLEENYLFDTRRFASGAVPAGNPLWFQSAIGAPGINNGFVSPMVMSGVETNMDVAGQIPQGKDFVLNQIGISFNADAAADDIALMLEIGSLEFSKQGGQYTLHHGPGVFWPGGQGVYAAPAASTAAGNGIPDIRAVRKLAVPRVLKARDNFNYSYNIPRTVRNLDNSTVNTLGDPVIMRIWLWGGQQDSIPV